MHGMGKERRYFLDYYRNHDAFRSIRGGGTLSDDAGFFRWGEDTICFGRSSAGARSDRADGSLYDILDDTKLNSAHVALPFDDNEIISNLLYEHYSNSPGKEPGLSSKIVRSMYYRLRPCLSVSLRKHLQKIYLRKWREIKFPEWPVDCTVDRIQRRLLALSMRACSIDSIPFIWFWPDGFESCAIITHDVEEARGRDFCARTIDLDEMYGFQSSYQVVPECRYEVPTEYLNMIVNRGCEVNVHDLNHDGRLYSDRQDFLRRAAQINEYGRKFGAVGFRSAILYRNADWFDSYDFLYDMSIPNVGHLDPQRGGCCTVMPYFIGELVELPVTCTQDYTLFNVLHDYSTDLWKRQIGIVMENHGLISMLVHPDYIIETAAQETYKEILRYLAYQRDAGKIWTPLPKAVAEWWRQRSEMELVCNGGKWRIEGEGRERARIAYALAAGDTVVYSLSPTDNHRDESSVAHINWKLSLAGREAI